MADLHHSDRAELGDQKLLAFDVEPLGGANPPAVFVHQLLTRTYSMTAGVPFGISYELTTAAMGIAVADFGSTAVLHFALPPGASVTSDAGFLQSPVPLPASAWLLGTAFSIVGPLRRRALARGLPARRSSRAGAMPAP